MAAMSESAEAKAILSMCTTLVDDTGKEQLVATTGDILHHLPKINNDVLHRLNKFSVAGLKCPPKSASQEAFDEYNKKVEDYLRERFKPDVSLRGTTKTKMVSYQNFAADFFICGGFFLAPHKANFNRAALGSTSSIDSLLEVKDWVPFGGTLGRRAHNRTSVTQLMEEWAIRVGLRSMFEGRMYPSMTDPGWSEGTELRVIVHKDKHHPLRGEKMNGPCIAPQFMSEVPALSAAFYAFMKDPDPKKKGYNCQFPVSGDKYVQVEKGKYECLDWTVSADRKNTPAMDNPVFFVSFEALGDRSIILPYGALAEFSAQNPAPLAAEEHLKSFPYVKVERNEVEDKINEKLGNSKYHASHVVIIGSTSSPMVSERVTATTAGAASRLAAAQQESDDEDEIAAEALDQAEKGMEHPSKRDRKDDEEEEEDY